MNNEQFVNYNLYHARLYALACELSQDLMNLVINYGDLPVLIERNRPDVIREVLSDSLKDYTSISTLLKEFHDTLMLLDNIIEEVGKQKIKNLEDNNDG